MSAKALVYEPTSKAACAMAELVVVIELPRRCHGVVSMLG
jgi:hypothetical protein